MVSIQKKPEFNSINLSDLKQIDRIQTHKTGHELESDGGTYVKWTDVPSKIELRSKSMTFTLENLKEPEVDWLCAELSDYLGIPVVTHTIGK